MPVKLDPHGTIKAVHFAGKVPWYFTFTAGLIDNSVNDDIYAAVPFSPYYQSTFDSSTHTGYSSPEYAVQKSQLPYDDTNVVLDEFAIGSIDQLPIAAGPSNTNFDAILAALVPNVSFTRHIVSGPSDTINSFFSMHDDTSLPADLTDPFIGYEIHIRAGDNHDNDPSTDLTSTTDFISSGSGGIFYHTGDGQFNRGFFHYYDLGVILRQSDFLFEAGSQYTILFNFTPGVR